MKIEKYVAPTMPEALAKVKADLGKDAVILQTRKISKGRAFDFFGREMVEVTAARPQPGTQARNSDDSQAALAQHVSANRARTVTFREHLQQKVKKTYKEGYGRDVEPQRIEQPLVQESRSLEPTPEIEELRTELQEVKATITGLHRSIADLNVAMQDMLTYMKRRSVAHFPKILQRFFGTLTRNGMEDELAKSLLEKVYTDSPSIDMADPNVVKGALIQRIAEKIKTADLAGTPDQHAAQRQVVAFIGPTGVGKTATLAKLAAKSRTQEGRQVAIVSTDICKMAAARQWEAFGEMMDIPIEEVYAPEEIRQAVDRHNSKDILFIDTVGRSQNDPGLMEELSKIIGEAQPTETHLVLSATAKDTDTLNAIERFSSIPTDYFVFTKLDETQTVGTLLNIIHAAGKPLSYLTTGPSITEDLAAADAFELARMILNDKEIDEEANKEEEQ